MIQFYFLFSALILSGCAAIQSGSSTSNREVKDQNQLVTEESSAQMRKRLAVLPFLDKPTFPENLKQESQIRFIEELNREGHSKAYLTNLVNCPLVNSEYDFKTCAIEAQKLGHHILVEGRILSLDIKRGSDPVGVVKKVKTTFTAVLRLRLFSIRGMKEVFNTDKTVTFTMEDTTIGTRGSTAQDLQNNPQLIEKIVVDGFLEFLPQIEKNLAKVSWEGRIAAIQGQKYYLNVGSVSGIQIGDLLKVYDLGPQIYDPEMGTSIGQAPGRVKGTLEVVSYFGQDGSIAILHSGGGFLENDRLEIY